MTTSFREIHCWSQDTVQEQTQLVFVENGDKIQHPLLPAPSVANLKIQPSY